MKIGSGYGRTLEHVEECLRWLRDERYDRVGKVIPLKVVLKPTLIEQYKKAAYYE